jgi:hypothetical protein
MTLVRPLRGAEFLQWFGLFAAALAWAGLHVVGYGLTEAECNPGGAGWGIDYRTWEIALTAAAATLAVAAEVAALAVLLATRGAEHDGPPPLARRSFFAAGAALANVLFLAIILLSGLGAIYNNPCHQS